MTVTPRHGDPRWHPISASARRLRAGTDRDVPLPDLDDTLPREPADLDALGALVHRWGIQSSVERVLTALVQSRD